MTKLYCNRIKTAKSTALVPCHSSDEDELKKLPLNQPLTVTVTRIRNIQFHRKYFALLNYAFDTWEPPDKEIPLHIKNAGPVAKSKDRFRKDICILAGFYESSYRLNGDIRIEAKSIAFHNMDESEFTELYEKTFDVILKHVLKNYTGDELRVAVDHVMEFDS